MEKREMEEHMQSLPSVCYITKLRNRIQCVHNQITSFVFDFTYLVYKLKCASLFYYS